MGNQRLIQTQTAANDQKQHLDKRTKQPEHPMQEVLGSRAASRYFRTQLQRPPAEGTSVPNPLHSILQSISFISPRAIQAKPMFRGLSHELTSALDSRGMVIQAKMTIGAPEDKYEQEADRVAEQVVQKIHAPSAPESMLGEPLQRQKQEEDGHALRMKPLAQRPLVGGVAATQDLETAINRARGGGQPLEAGLQRKMGKAMGADFSGVRIHADSQSDQLNRSIQAKAFTTGQDVFFRQGAYEPGSLGGQELIAHELTHVVQQQPKQSLEKNQIQKQVGNMYVSPLSDVSSQSLGGDSLVVQRKYVIPPYVEAILFDSLFSGNLLNLGKAIRAYQQAAKINQPSQLKKVSEAMESAKTTTQKQIDLFNDVLAELETLSPTATSAPQQPSPQQQQPFTPTLVKPEVKPSTPTAVKPEVKPSTPAPVKPEVKLSTPSTKVDSPTASPPRPAGRSLPRVNGQMGGFPQPSTPQQKPQNTQTTIASASQSPPTTQDTPVPKNISEPAPTVSAPMTTEATPTTVIIPTGAFFYKAANGQGDWLKSAGYVGDSTWAIQSHLNDGSVIDLGTSAAAKKIWYPNTQPPTVTIPTGAFFFKAANGQGDWIQAQHYYQGPTTYAIQSESNGGSVINFSKNPQTGDEVITKIWVKQTLDVLAPQQAPTQESWANAPQKADPELVDKHKANTTYTQKSGDLFPKEGPKAEHVKQGELGDCYLMAALAAITMNDPDYVRQMIRENNDGTVTVRLYEPSPGSSFSLAYTPRLIKVTKAVPQSDGKDRYAKDHLWVQMIEKAYAAGGFTGKLLTKQQGNHSYQGIASGIEQQAFRVLLGQDATYEGLSEVTDDEQKKNALFLQIQTALEDKKPITLGTKKFGDLPMHKQKKATKGAGLAGEDILENVVLQHAYSVIRTEADKFSRYLIVRNPWGGGGGETVRKGSQEKEDKKGEIRISLGNLTSYFSNMTIGPRTVSL